MDRAKMQKAYESVCALMTDIGGGSFATRFENNALKVYDSNGIPRLVIEMSRREYVEYLDYADSIEGVSDD